MKLAFFDDFKLGIVVDDKIIDVSSVTKGSKALGPQEMIRTVIEKWSAYKSKLAAAAKKGKGMPLSKAVAETREHCVHVRQLHGGWHALRARADQRFHEIPERRHRRPRRYGAAGYGGQYIRGRGGTRRRHRQACVTRQGG